MRNFDAIFILIVAVFSAVMGFVLGIAITQQGFKEKCINNNIGFYAPTNGIFYLKDYTGVDMGNKKH